MRSTHYYKLSFALPLVLPPIVLVGVAGLLDLLKVQPSIGSEAEKWGIFVMGSVLVGGVPYVLFATCALLYLRKRDTGAHRRVVIAAPLLFAPIAFGVMFAVSAGEFSDFVDFAKRVI